VNGRLAVVSIELPPGAEGPPQHVHERLVEIFCVTRGRVRFVSAGRYSDAAVGTSISVPPGVPHAYSNPFGETATLVASMSSDDPVEVIRGMAELPTGPDGRPSLGPLERLMAHHDTILYRPRGPRRPA
jgi:quercetin dioxygenase-like cupin family protein